MKVGSYIHYRYKNYSKYGLRVNDGTHPDPTAVFNAQRQDILNNAKSKFEGNKAQVKAELEKRLNFYFSPEASGIIKTGYTDAQVAALQSKIMQIFEQTISSLGKAELLNKTRIDYNTLAATGGNNVNLGDSKSALSSKRKNAIGGKKADNVIKQFTKLYAVDARIKELVKVRDTLSKNLEATSQIDKDFIQKVDAFQEKYDKLIETVSKNAETNRGNYKISDLGINFVQDLQALMDMTKQITNTAIEGYLGEYLPAISAEIYNRLEEESIEDCLSYLNNNTNAFIELIKGEVVGGNTSRKATSKNKFIENTKKDQQSKFSTDTKLGKKDAHSNYTQDKVDVHFELPDGVVNASMKNVNFYSGKIHILSGSSTANFIQDYPEFANHYLNITANIGRPDRPNSNVLMLAHNTFKLTLALHALMGGVLVQEKGASGLSRSEKADVFIVNDNSQKGHFKVYFISDLIRVISEDLSLLSIENFKDPTQYNNNWLGDKKPDIDTAFARVGKILSQLQVQKLQMSISTKALI